MKQQEDGWLDTVRESILRMSTSTFFYQSSIGNQSLSIVRYPGEEFRLNLDSLAGLDCQPNGW